MPKNSSNPSSQEKLLADHKLFTENLDGLAKAVGHVVIAFNMLERSLGQMIALMLNQSAPQKVSDSLNAALGYSQKVDLLAALFLSKPRPEHEQSLLKFCMSELRYAEEQRNHFVHSAYSTEQFGGTTFKTIKERVRGGKGLKVTEAFAEASQIMEVAEHMRRLWFLDLSALYRCCSGKETDWTQPIMT